MNNESHYPAAELNLVKFQVQYVKGALHSQAGKAEYAVQSVQSAQARADWLSPVQAAATWVLTFVRLTRMRPKSPCRFAVTCCRLSFQNSHEPQQI